MNYPITRFVSDTRYYVIAYGPLLPATEVLPQRPSGLLYVQSADGTFVLKRRTKVAHLWYSDPTSHRLIGPKTKLL